MEPARPLTTAMVRPKASAYSTMPVLTDSAHSPSASTTAPADISQRTGYRSSMTPAMGVRNNPRNVPKVKLYITCSRLTSNSARTGATRRLAA